MSENIINPGTLYIVATPIGNLGDISSRALSVLTQVDIIACEDTRHTQRLLSAHAIKNKTLSMHDHNERQRQDYIAQLLQEGKSIALVSDAGTPLISDPGFHLVRHCRSLNLPVSPIPGACAAIAALSVAGLPTDRFSFEGFLPSKSGARQSTLLALINEPRTMVFYDAPRRAIDTVKDIVATLGGERYVVIARELTKTFETIHSDTAENFLAWLEQDANQLKGEMVLIIEGYKADPDEISAEVIKTLKLLLVEMKPKKACAIVAEIYGVKKNALYDIALSLKV
ncbi:16S rRNA (cytidine(1402)-2'-O)-methyltransferase [Colwellia sp. 4_MG-2023]|jgi:16S rRNA (cytidine1402-2'-O)-methyltransferase|uniref:16S rRNA (cytidine(1402)-2'-O)-methyltransferase n=1 Tax=unclassified Colwellia TaxID=196834 RepID=UPI001C097076|nr:MULTISPECIES: 16S rRNA (cytidine(1402)-2'-O)-methyltransferase [unclassified Colwellia]MBU2926235.1 16S rRNA (cytidine(1402)-2'-O)-methyltransferase [Colwellia sp. C2M11]MDO6489455.1 16S rRNA (cytidine(1402)-2'-O)-methyltransferase [Colwellia sp. 6_MG-2023]MDO6508481.1 16S rRNA (cytidine(1402)-2'-O)-methyltransferase [Colwellia sp. 5_MG-2023]MDO6557096.1 16S rRNA (cytidine(1402)-2'-O)-methyltransferase [Colwellia sp. 4_MG-2023]MDO6652343.1 16S rRNA (cytidine(1402)-2'-O)-methyltransferase [C